MAESISQHQQQQQVTRSQKTIGTHSGTFHADEVLACALLQRFTDEFRGAPITRTRDPAVLDTLDIIVDVGGVYAPERHRYDHHQREFSDTFSEKYTIRLSSAGLVYKHFGREILRNAITKILAETKLIVELKATPQELTDILYERVYEGFIQGIDGVDNGVDQYPTELKPRYEIKSSFSSVIGRFNPMWSVEGQDENEQFVKALDVAEQEFLWQVRGPLLAWYPGRSVVEEAIKNRFSVHESGKIIVLSQSVPWKDHLDDIEKEQNIAGQLRFVIFSERGGAAWRVQGINVANSFETRLGVKKEWRGIKDMQLLKQTSGIEDIVFVHASGFIGGAKSYDSTLKMGVISLQDEKPTGEQ